MQHGIKSPLCWLLIVLALSGVQDCAALKCYHCSTTTDQDTCRNAKPIECSTTAVGDLSTGILDAVPNVANKAGDFFTGLLNNNMIYTCLKIDINRGTDEAEVIDTRRGCIQVSRNEIVTRDKCKTFLAVASHVRLDTLKFCELCDNEDGCNQASTLLPTTCLVLVTLLAKLVFL